MEDPSIEDDRRETASFFDGRVESYRGETLGGGGGGVVGEGMFHEGAGGSWGREREIIGL